MDVCVELLFAFDLIRFVMNEYNLSWLSDNIAYLCRGQVPTTFVPSIGQVIYKLSCKNYAFRRKELVRLMRRETILGQYFKDLSTHAVCMCLSEGFCMLDFIQFCSYMAAVAAEYFKRGAKDIPGQAIAVIAESLRDNEAGFIAEGSWKSLCIESIHILQSDILVKRNCLFACSE